MKIVIVAKTHMGCLACVGGLALDSARNVRLLNRDGYCQSSHTRYQVGDLWDVICQPVRKIVPPHVEDVLVQKSTFLDREPNMVPFLLRKVCPWKGEAESLFDGCVRFSSQGRPYISKAAVPTASVGFWAPDRELTKVELNWKTHYLYPAKDACIKITYTGFAPAVDVLPAGSLLRVSLARWWRPADAPQQEERCYLQLSGWYDISGPESKSSAHDSFKEASEH
jgi:ATP-dependent DNA helicase RecQ